jgi:hypothetical protein
MRTYEIVSCSGPRLTVTPGENVADVFGLAVIVTSTRAPFLSFTWLPCRSIKAFLIRRFRYRRAVPSMAICAFSGCPRAEEEMICPTVPGTVVLAHSGICAVSRFRSIILADLDMRGFAISILMLSTVVVPDTILLFFRGIHLS